MAGGPTTPAQPAAKDEINELITLTYASLPTDYQAVLQAKYERQLSVAQIARSCGKSPKAVESLLSRARAAFRQVFRHFDRQA